MVRRQCLFALCSLGASALALAGDAQPDPLDQLSGEALAQVVCQACHLRPDPSLLDKRTWEKHTLPWMSTKLGITKLDLNKLPGGRLVREAQILPESPLLTSHQWQKICNYYISLAPDQPLAQGPRPEIKLDLEDQFTVIKAPFHQPTPMTTLVKMLPGKGLIFAGDSLRRSLYMLDDAGRQISSFKLGLPPVDLDLRREGLYVTLIGYVAPADDPIGRFLFFPNSLEGFEPPTVLLDHLARPCNTQIVDLNGDGREDLLICQFGNLLGRLSWFEKLASGQSLEHPLRETPGALNAYVRDFNHDGLPDVMALMSQAQEGVYLFSNHGQGHFEEKVLLQWPPVWGSTWFELADFNGDGYPDLLVTNGDNAEYPSPMKNFHGVRIYLNNGKNEFHEAMFFPLNGAYKAVARDFDGDGKLDIAAISFFPDYLKSPQESFVYLHNEGDLRFTAHSFAACTSGRWIVMDAGDLDGDGAPDIVLGAFDRGPETIPIPPEIRRQWENGPNILILKNKGKVTPR